MKVIGKQKNSKMCIICGMDNPIGLKAQFYNMEDESVMTIFKYREEHQSFPKRVHGGLIATMLDELGLRALWAKNSNYEYGVTLSMEVKYRKPVPYNEVIIGRGLVKKESSKFIVIDTELFDKKGNLLANAEVKYIKMDISKITQEVTPHDEMCYLIEDDVKEINFEIE
ncbi:MAG: PaaI family thioesterase [Clostridia bacterium]|nr:PaaI family thioesterase [Clostridia bacterium]